MYPGGQVWDEVWETSRPQKNNFQIMSCLVQDKESHIVVSYIDAIIFQFGSSIMKSPSNEVSEKRESPHSSIQGTKLIRRSSTYVIELQSCGKLNSANNRTFMLYAIF